MTEGSLLDHLKKLREEWKVLKSKKTGVKFYREGVLAMIDDVERAVVGVVDQIKCRLNYVKKHRTDKTFEKPLPYDKGYCDALTIAIDELEKALALLEEGEPQKMRVASEESGKSESS